MDIKKLIEQAKTDSDLRKIFWDKKIILVIVILFPLYLSLIIYIYFTSKNRSVFMGESFLLTVMCGILIAVLYSPALELYKVLTLVSKSDETSNFEASKESYFRFRIQLQNKSLKMISRINSGVLDENIALNAMEKFFESIGGTYAMSEGEYRYYSGNKYASYSLGEDLLSRIPSAARISLPFVRTVNNIGTKYIKRSHVRGVEQEIKRIVSLIEYLDGLYNIQPE